MKFLLVNPPIGVFYEAVVPPIGLSYLAAALRQPAPRSSQKTNGPPRASATRLIVTHDLIGIITPQQDEIGGSRALGSARLGLDQSRMAVNPPST